MPIMKTSGKCRICEKILKQNAMGKHIITCAQNLNSGKNAFLIKASNGPFWVYFSVPSNKELLDVDDFLRDLWLECCGHLSCFSTENKRYFSHDEDLQENEEIMEIPLVKVLKKGTKMHYEYDFGTPTELQIECLSIIKTNSKDIKILARNDEPDFFCDCDEKAKNICVSCMWEKNGFLCKNCSKKHDCEESYFLPVVNSPRIGMCGFTGEDCPLIDE